MLELKFILRFLKFYLTAVCTCYENPINPAYEEEGIEDTCFL